MTVKNKKKKNIDTDLFFGQRKIQVVVRKDFYKF